MAPVAEDSVNSIKTKEKKSRCSSPMNVGDSDSEMLNLEKDLYSLTHYADDAEELVAQMFSTIKGPKLNAMLPPILKEIPLIDVQQLCLHELRGMSSRRILSIINGVEMSDSSSDDDDDNLKNKSNQGVKDGDSPIKEENADESMEDDPNLVSLGMSELEMRAQLIKNLLTKDGDDDAEFDPNIKIKDEPPSPQPRSRRKKRNTSGSSSRSSQSNSSYRNRSGSYSRSSSRSYSSSSGCESELQRMKEEAQRSGKKKITKKEFEERMRKAKMNRSYRKRKESDDDSANESRSKNKKNKKRSSRKSSSKNDEPDLETDPTQKEQISEKDATEGMDERVLPLESPVEGEQHQQQEEDAEEEEEEKEEGEIDSHEEVSFSDLSSGSYSSDSGSDSRRRRKRRSKKHQSRSPSVPKVPNWEPGNTAVLPKPIPEDRQSISFAFGTKTTLPANEEEQCSQGVDKLALQEENSQEISKVTQLEASADEEQSQDPMDGVEEEIEEVGKTTEGGSFDPDAITDHSWSTRWLQSEKVQQVVSDSKMLSKMRKNIQAKGKVKVKKTLLKKPLTVSPAVQKTEGGTLKQPLKMKMVRGAVVDPESDFGLTVKVPQTLPTPKPPKAPIAETSATKSKSLSVLLGSDDEDDSEDDELWSQIMKS